MSRFIIVRNPESQTATVTDLTLGTSEEVPLGRTQEPVSSQDLPVFEGMYMVPDEVDLTARYHYYVN